jgi:glucokinase
VIKKGNGMRPYAIGIDIGGSSAKIALVNRRARIIARASTPCDPRLPWKRILRNIATAAGGLGEKSGMCGVGIGCAGCIDVVRGVVRFSPNLPLWKAVPLKAFMEEALGLPCILDNDVNMMAVAESRYGAARGARNVCCLTVGTGVGGGLLCEGELYRGQSMSAGELGHIQVEPEGLSCSCGNRGCLERYIGREGLVRLARIAMRGKRSVLTHRRELTPIAIADAARRGDAVAKAVWEKAGYYLGLSMVGVVNLLNPDVIVVGGGIGNAGNLLLNPARRIVRERALQVPARHVRIVRSVLGEDAGVIGAAAEVFEKINP